MANANSAQTGYMSTYDASDTTSVIDGTVLFGFQSGDFVTWAWDNDKVAINGDSYGTEVISKNNKNSAKVTWNLNQQSPCNAKLADLCNQNQEFPIDIRSDTEHLSASHCIINRIPSGGNGDEASVRAWEITALNLDYERLDAMP